MQSFVALFHGHPHLHVPVTDGGFHPGERAEHEDIRLAFDLDRMILEGLRLADQPRAQR